MPASLATCLRSLVVVGIAFLAPTAAVLAQTTEDVPGTVLPCTAVNEPLNFPAYWLGSTFDGLELSAVLRSCGPGYPGEIGTNDVSFIYGDCTPQGGGCAPPVTIQTSPAGLHPAIGGSRNLEFEDAAVKVFADGGRADAAVDALVEAPRVLTELEAHGISFDEDCLADPGGCQGDTSLLTGDLGWVMPAIWILVLFVVPFALSLVVGRAWTLLVPVVLNALLFGAATFGLVATGETWQVAFAFYAALSFGAAALGLSVHRLVAAARSRRSAAA